MNLPAAVRGLNGIVLVSTLAAAASLMLALAVTRPGAQDRFEGSHPQHATAEQVAERFVDAFLAEDYARAAGLATPAFARTVRERIGHRRTPPATAGCSWLLQESHMLRANKLRLVGVLLEAGQDESTGWPLAVTVVERRGRYLVDEVHWSKGPPTTPQR